MRLLFVLFLMGCSGSGSVAPSMTPTPLPVPPGAQEQAQWVPLDNTYSVSSKIVIYSKTVNVHSGDSVLINGMAELTNDTGGNVGVGRYLAKMNVSTLVDHAEMTNVTPEMHHLIVQQLWIDLITTDGPVTYLFVVYAVSLDGQSGYLKVEQGYGGMEVTIIGSEEK